MNVMAAVRSYVDKIVGDPNSPGMKVLLLDEWTTKTVAMVYSQTEILDRDIYLVERLDQAQNHEVMKHLKACVFVRPTPANFAVLTQEVRRAKFSEYHVFFSNVVPGDALKALAEADENEVVRQVQEYYADFVPVNAELFSLNQRQSLRLSTELRDARAPASSLLGGAGRAAAFGRSRARSGLWEEPGARRGSQRPLGGARRAPRMLPEIARPKRGRHTHAFPRRFHQDMFARNVNGLLSALLSLKLQPSVIRYAGASRVAKAVAAECASQIAADGIFHFASGKRGGAGPLLLVLDRADDAVTPLLSAYGAEKVYFWSGEAFFLAASSRGEFAILAASSRSSRPRSGGRGAPASPRLDGAPASPRWTLRSGGGTRAASNRPASRKTPRSPAGRSGRTRPWSTSSWA